MFGPHSLLLAVCLLRDIGYLRHPIIRETYSQLHTDGTAADEIQKWGVRLNVKMIKSLAYFFSRSRCNKPGQSVFLYKITV